jgi:hypothetical protein
MRIFLIAAFTLLIHGSAQAWTRPGHMVTAAIAYDELTDAVLPL